MDEDYEVSCNFERKISKNIVIRRWQQSACEYNCETYRSVGFCFINFLIWDCRSVSLGRVPKIDVLGIIGRVFCRQIGTPVPLQFKRHVACGDALYIGLLNS